MVAPIVADLSWPESWDVEFRSGSNVGRLGALLAKDGQTVESAALSSGVRKALHFSVNGGAADATLGYPINYSAQFFGQDFAGAYTNFRHLYFEAELHWTWDSNFSLTDSNRLQFLRIQESSTNRYSFSIAADRHLRVFSLGGTQLGDVSLPDRGTTFKLRCKLDSTAGTLEAWYNETAGYPDSGWVQCADFSGLSTATNFDRIVFNGFISSYNETNPFETYWFSAGWYADRALNPSSGTEETTLPILSSLTDDEVWSLIEHDDWRQCMTLDVTRTAFSARIAMEKGRLADSWAGYYGWIQWAETEADLLANNGTVTDAVNLGASPRSDVGNVGHIQVHGLKPGKTYWWRPILGDGDGPGASTFGAIGPAFRVRTGYPANSGNTLRYVVGSCKKNWARFMPTPPLYIASQSVGDVDRVIIQDDVFYNDEAEFENEGGAAYLWDDGHTRLARQGLEDPLMTALLRKASCHLQFGDHDFGDNNWDWTWWNTNSSDSLTATKYSNETTPTKGGLIDNGVSWWNASFADGFFNHGVDDDSAFSTVPYREARRFWRHWHDGDYHFIQLDTRRHKNQTGQSISDQLSDDQHNWLIDQLRDGDGAVKVILSPSPVGDLYTNSDNWLGHLAARDAFIDAIRDNLPHSYQAIILSGDRHLPFVAQEIKNGSVAANGGGNNAALTTVLAEFNCCPLGSTNSHGDATDQASSDLLWRLRTDDGGGSNEPDEPDSGDQVFALTTMTFDAFGVAWRTYDVDGELMDDQDGNSAVGSTARVSVAATAVQGEADMPVRLTGTVTGSPTATQFDVTMDDAGLDNNTLHDKMLRFESGNRKGDIARVISFDGSTVKVRGLRAAPDANSTFSVYVPVGRETEYA